MKHFIMELSHNKPFFMLLATTLGILIACLVDEYTKNREE